MKKSSFSFVHFWIYPFMTLLLACNLPAKRPVVPTPFIPTMIVSASPVPTSFILPPTVLPSTPLPVVQPTLTLAPIGSSPNTSIPIPCNRAEFVGDVSIPDGTQISAGAAYTKVWRLRNTGSCTWTSGYVMLFDHGDPMSGTSGQPLLSGSVPPGAVVDVSVTLKAPSQPGTFQAYFRLRSPDNIVFGIGNSGQDSFWVRITVPQPTAVPTNSPVPALPSFAPLLQFGGGGARTYLCTVQNYPNTLPSFHIMQEKNILYICIYGGNLRSPFRLKFNPTGGETTQQIDFLPSAFMINNIFGVQWQGYSAANTNRGTMLQVPAGNDLYIFTQSVEIIAGLPVDSSAVDWQVQASGENGDFHIDGQFTLEKTGTTSHIGVVNQVGGNQFDPLFDYQGLFYQHLLKLDENGGINVIGTDFPANTPVYVLLYHAMDSATYQLENQRTLQADSSGSISKELAGPFTVGDSYLVFGVTDPNAQISEESAYFNSDVPHDFFKLVSP